MQLTGRWSLLMHDSRPVTATRTTHLALVMGLVAVTTVVYWLLGPTGSGGSVYGPLAEALLDGRLWILDRPWLELVPVTPGALEQYVPLPPAPALTLLPAVAVLGPDIAPNIPAALVGGLNVGLVYMLAQRFASGTAAAVAIALAFAGATHLWVAGNGGPHHYASRSRMSSTSCTWSGSPSR